MLVRVKQLENEEAELLMRVYQESNKENISYFFPEEKDLEKGLKMVEAAHVSWLRDEFLKEEHTSVYIWAENGVWISGLRLHEVGERCYFIEALETHPKYRKQGYAEKLLKSIIDELKAIGSFKIESYTSTKNIASQKTHEKSGFVRGIGQPFDYTSKEYVEDAVAYAYSHGGSN